MMGHLLALRSRPVLTAVLVASLILALSVSVILASVRGTGPGDFGFAEALPAELPADADIGGWVTFDKDSYLPGETARCRVRVLWRGDVVTPDFESFQTSVSFFPLDHRESFFSERNLAGGVREYLADFVLQAVNVTATESYLLATATVYFTENRVESGELQALRINPPTLHIGEYYPRDISAIPLLAPKPAIAEPTRLRQWLLALFGLTLLGLAASLVRRYGRQRAESELSAAERLWYEFDGLRADAAGARQFLLDCERIFLHALFLRTGVGPMAFWSDPAAVDGELRAPAAEARSLLDGIYRPGQPGQDHADRMSALVGEMLEPLVAGARLRREQLPSFTLRLKSEPAVLATAALVTISAVVLLALAALPSSWVSSEIARYNMAARMLDAGETLAEGFDEFSTLARDARDEMVRAASLYNVGALLTDPRLSGQSPERQRQLLNSIFVADITLDRLLHDLELDAVTELLGILTDAARRHVQAESAMKAAVRLTPHDTDAGRNLEILGKIRNALANTLARLIVEGEQSVGLLEMQQQTIIDLQRLMEVEMPEDFARMEEGKDDSNYFILEQF